MMAQVIAALDSNPVLAQTTTKRLILDLVAHGMSEARLASEVLERLRSYGVSLPEAWSERDRARVVSALVTYLKGEIREQLRRIHGDVDGDPPGYSAAVRILADMLNVYDAGDAAITEALIARDREGFARAYARVEKGQVEHTWPLQVSPLWYLSRYPDGEHSDLARTVLRERQGEAPNGGSPHLVSP